MASNFAAKRLKKELLLIQRDPVENITALPMEDDILIWHYVIRGAKGSPYEGGYYHGKVRFPSEYPLKPPGIWMCTPSGRFKPNTKLCLSMSDFHPETWNPMWSVGTILMGLQAFMLDTSPTYGSIETSMAQKRRMAAESMDFNKRDPQFCALFPAVIQEAKERRLKEEAARKAAGLPIGPEVGARKTKDGEGEEGDIVTFIVAVGIVLGILAILLRIRS